MTRTSHRGHRPRVLVGAFALVLYGIWASPPVAAADPSDSGQLNWRRRGDQPVTAIAQQNLSIAQPLPAAASGQPAATAGKTSVTVLRWRTSDISRTQAAVSGSSQPVRLATITATNSVTAHAEPAAAPLGTSPRAATPIAVTAASSSKYPIRQVSAEGDDLPLAVPDAFADPFEDAARLRQAPPRVSEPAQIEAVQLLAPQPAEPVIMEQAWQDDPPPAPLVPGDELLPNQDPDELPPPPAAAQQRKQAPCEQVYNQRDCCADAERCSEARDQWAHDAIAKISLDITPSMFPREKDPVVAEEKRNSTLAQSPVRSWHDRQQNVLVEGRLTNIERGKALILNADNQIVPVAFNQLSDDDICFLTAWWNVPTECTLGDEVYEGRNWMASTMTWKASALCHKPLYFEQVQVERYGHSAGPITQPLLSGAHFFTSLVALPYQAGINPPWECQYTLGYYRPGSCAPWMVPPVPLSIRGGLLQAGAVVGGVAIFP